MALEDILHDEIDKIEEIRIASAEIVEDVFWKLADAAAISSDIRLAPQIIASEIAMRAAKVTTDAFHAGVDFVEKREKQI